MSYVTLLPENVTVEDDDCLVAGRGNGCLIIGYMSS